MRSSESMTVAPTADEVGFLLLEDYVCRFDCQGLETNTWLNVDFSDGEIHQEEVDVCLRGTIALQVEEGGMKLRSTARFNGNIADVHHSSSCPPCCQAGQTNRSDLSLLLGLAMTCQDSGHIHIERMQIMLRTEAVDKHNDEASEIENIAFLITFSMPLLVESTRKKLKALPSSTQLLLSIMRSDWDYLSSDMGFKAAKRFQYGGEMRRDSLFPTKMSLEELYSRLRSLQTRDAKMLSLNNTSRFAMLPDKVLLKIAPFLRARSLNALRSACSELHYALKAVVPGLKLTLHSHQIRSLEWMRSREVHECTENDVIDKISSSWSVDGDCHRCITAGATVLLRPRRTPDMTFRIDTQSGRVCKDFKSSRGSTHLSRRAARGGLLCDDPGLGKTITVLSLILQTMGLSSEERPQTEHETFQVHQRKDQDDVFHAYWRDQLDPIFQRHELNRLTRLAQRLDGESVFRRPVCTFLNPNYLEVIEKPMCFLQISRNIESERYTNDFSAYVKDVKLIFRNAMEYNDQDDEVFELAKDMRREFKGLVAEVKKKIIQTARKSFSNSTGRPNSSVAAILERKFREEYMKSLVSSCATLLVVPETLLNHWVVS